MTYRLYLYPNSYALTVHAVLEELALDHELKWVGIFQDTPDPDLLKVSPHSRVPALEGDDLVLFETGAIALYLAEQHGDGALLIPPGDPAPRPLPAVVPLSGHHAAARRDDPVPSRGLFRGCRHAGAPHGRFIHGTPGQGPPHA